MKKLFISIIALVSAMTMSAQITADVTLRLQSQSGSVCELYLFAGPDLAASPERGSFMANASNPEDVNIFALDPANNNRYASFGNETLVNIPVGIITSKEEAALQNYTIHFEVFEDAEVLKLKDLVTGTETDITNGGSYAFTIAAATDPSYVEGAYSVIANRFFINYNAAALHSVKTNDYGFCSFASASAVTLPAGLKAYKGDFNIDDYSIALSYIGQVVPANEGVILWNPNESAETFYYTVGGSSSADMSDNDFVGAVVAKPVDEIVAAAIYCLHGNELMKYVGTEDIPAGKAYLPVAGSSAAPQRIRMVFHETEQTEAVSNVEATVKAEKFVENGQIYIRRGNEVFNLQGQIVK